MPRVTPFPAAGLRGKYFLDFSAMPGAPIPSIGHLEGRTVTVLDQLAAMRQAVIVCRVESAFPPVMPGPLAGRVLRLGPILRAPSKFERVLLCVARWLDRRATRLASVARAFRSRAEDVETR